MENVNEIKRYFSNAVDYSGLTVEEILSQYDVTIDEVCEIMDETGCSVEEAMNLIEDYED